MLYVHTVRADKPEGRACMGWGSGDLTSARSRLKYSSLASTQQVSSPPVSPAKRVKKVDHISAPKDDVAPEDENIAATLESQSMDVATARMFESWKRRTDYMVEVTVSQFEDWKSDNEDRFSHVSVSRT